MTLMNRHRYCAQCCELLTQHSSGYGWCEQCEDLVSLTSCRVPYWAFGVVVFLAYNMHMGLLT
jgi:hypothetical protein